MARPCLNILFSNADVFDDVGPLVGIEKKINNGLDFIDPDDLEDYVTGK